MPWWKVVNDELVGAERIHGPGWLLDANTPANQDRDGWRKFGNETAARNAFGIPRPVTGQDRVYLDYAISGIAGNNLRAALENLRRESPDPV